MSKQDCLDVYRAAVSPGVEPRLKTSELESHHVEHGHHQDESCGRHGEDQSQPGVVGDNDARGSREPWQGAERALPSLLWMQRNRKSDLRRRTNGDKHVFVVETSHTNPFTYSPSTLL